MDAIIPTRIPWALVAVVAVVGALLLHVVIWRVVLRVMTDRTLAQDLFSRCRWPARAVVTTGALLLTLPLAGSNPPAQDVVFHLLELLLITAAAWLAARAVRVAEGVLMRRYDIDVPDNLRARRLRTQVRVLGRVIVVAIYLVAVAGMLLTFPRGRTLGASLLASAGIAGVLASVAARSTLGNLVAGLQIAFAEPIRLDDVVVVEGEWGNVEEITLTFVVVRLWDRRRLVLPTSYFLERPIQNWTRYSADIVGSVHLYVDYSTPVEEVRQELARILARSELWDGQVSILQVIDATERTMVLRALVSASTAPRAWDLRCEVREHLLAWLDRTFPSALPRLRADVEAGGPERDTGPHDAEPRDAVHLNGPVSGMRRRADPLD